MTVYLYHLLDQYGRLRYVGTSQKPHARVRQHWSKRFHNPDPLGDWLRDMERAGFKPTVRVVRECQDRYADERAEIQALLAAGERIVNATGSGRKRRASGERSRQSGVLWEKFNVSLGRRPDWQAG